MDDISLTEQSASATANLSIESQPAVDVLPAGNTDPVIGSEAAAVGRAQSTHYIYAIGRVRPQFPGLSVEREFAQTMSVADTNGLTDSQAFHAVISDAGNRYLARQLCWTMAIEGIDMYLLVLRDSADLDLLIDAVRPRPSPSDVDVVIGMLGGLAPANVCNGMQLPIVFVDQLYSFEREELLAAIPRPSGQKDKNQFEASSNELFDRIMESTDNLGATDEHRALNYLAVRSPAIYARAAAAVVEGASLSSIETRLSRLSGIRVVVDVILSFTNRQTDYTEKSFVRVDVTEEFPFIVTKLGPYYDR